MTVKSASVSCGVSTAVGSSRMSTWASRIERLEDLDPLLDADREVLDERRRGRPRGRTRGESRADVGAALRRSRKTEAPGRLEAEDDVLGDREDGYEHEVLVDHADAAPHGVARVGESDRLAVDADLARSPACSRPKSTFMSVRLAGAVLAEKAVDLALLDGQVHVRRWRRAGRSAW